MLAGALGEVALELGKTRERADLVEALVHLETREEPLQAESVQEIGEVGDGTGVVKMWFHARAGAERTTLADQVERFNALGTGARVELVRLPDGDYSRQLEAAGREDKLPDLFDFDGAELHRHVYRGLVVPVDTLLPARTTGDLLDSVRAQGTVDGRLYAPAQVE